MSSGENKNPATRDVPKDYNRFQLQRRKRTLMTGFLFTTIFDHTDENKSRRVRSFLIQLYIHFSKNTP